MEIEGLGLTIYLLYLILPIFVGYLAACKSYIRHGLFLVSIVTSSIISLSLYIAGVFLWLIFCFSADIGWSIETFPMIGILLGFIALVLSILIYAIALLLRRKKLTELRNNRELEENIVEER